MKFVVRTEASEEIVKQYSWCEEAKLGLGEEFLAELDVVFDYIKSYPESFEKNISNFGLLRLSDSLF